MYRRFLITQDNAPHPPLSIIIYILFSKCILLNTSVVVSFLLYNISSRWMYKILDKHRGPHWAPSAEQTRTHRTHIWPSDKIYCTYTKRGFMGLHAAPHEHNKLEPRKPSPSPPPLQSTTDVLYCNNTRGGPIWLHHTQMDALFGTTGCTPN